MEKATASRVKARTKKKELHALPSSSELRKDYALGQLSRAMSLLARKEVFMGRAKFGIFGDGKEIPQLAMARAFEPGDWRAGYYRDQTLMMALGLLKPQQFFAQLYAHTSFEDEPASSGRMMTAHFGSPLLDEDGQWMGQLDRPNSSLDISPTAAQMPRLLGLAYASKLYRSVEQLQGVASRNFSRKGNEIAWGTIGDASTSEGMFFEVMNAAAVLQVPMLVSVWDDGYGISVPKQYQTAKESISDAMAGFQHQDNKKGIEIRTVKGWDYEALYANYQEVAQIARQNHRPVLMQIEELTQPQGHSTSGSHTRYKSKARLQWEEEKDGLKQMRHWLLEKGHATEAALDKIEAEAQSEATSMRDQAWHAFTQCVASEAEKSFQLIDQLEKASPSKVCSDLSRSLRAEAHPQKAQLIAALRQSLYVTVGRPSAARDELEAYLQSLSSIYRKQYSSHLYSVSSSAATSVTEEVPRYATEPKQVDGREVLQTCFDELLRREPRFFAIGEDLGYIGDVNQGFAGLQEKYGEARVTDTGIREASIVGQGIGAALRGLRPLVEIQYLDYMLYALQILSDDLATLHYRSAGRQKAPLIIRTRGHRLEGIWHSGSPMGVLLHALRGMHIIVPRDMTRAAAFYNTLFEGDEPALLIETLNGYRRKEPMPDNVGSMKAALGKPEILRSGTDLTLLTYGPLCHVAMQACTRLEEMNISVELIDLQTLLPFDTEGVVRHSLERTNRLLIVDEDVPGGASAYILQQIIDQAGYELLDTTPRLLSAQPHRPAYSTDGDYFSKPNLEDIIEAAYASLHESDPQRYPSIYT